MTSTTEPLDDAVRRLPRWLLAVLGILLVLVGVVLVLSPFASLSVLVVLLIVAFLLMGTADLVGARRSASPALSVVTGVLWIAGAAVIMFWPGITLRVVTVVVGVALVADGVLRLVAAVRGTVDQRATAAILGTATMVLGALALAWPDITVFVVAVVFGARVVLYGLSLLWDAIRGRRGSAEPAPGRRHRWVRTVGALVALAVALGLVGVSSALQRAAPAPDAFYAAPAEVPAEPGVLLRSEPFTRGIPGTADAWRILYTTTRDEGQPALASGIVLVSRSAPAGPRPVIAWAHGTTGYDPSCAPTLATDPLGSGALPALSDIVDQGWVLVATDYVGLGTEGPHPYLIGQGEGRSVLDAVRAARSLPDVAMTDETVVWGHSQGGHAALWTGQLATSYAPDVDVVGVAALAPASNLTSLVGNLEEIPGGALFASYVAQAYSEIYPDVRFDDIVAPTARVQLREMAARCLAEPEVFVSIVESFLYDSTFFAGDPTQGAVGERLRQNIPLAPIAAPLLVGQGGADPLVLPSAQEEYVEQRCAAGGAVDYRVYPGRDHVGVVLDDSPLIPELVAWTQDRFDGEPATPTCGG